MQHRSPLATTTDVGWEVDTVQLTHAKGALLRRYKNEFYPSIAVTVDLLTTGIDVPEITNLLFLRLVKSRILYQQMIGRATRLCSDIGKE